MIQPHSQYSAPMKCYSILLGIVLSLCASLSAHGGTIRTAISTTQAVDDAGGIELKIVIRNDGNAMAHNMRATVILGKLVKEYRDLGDNPPGGEIELKDQFVNPDLSPGKYIGILCVHFEEQNGRSHRVYHFFHMAYLKDGIRQRPSPILLKTEGPVFNKKTFWEGRRPIRVPMKNEGKKPVNLNIWLFLPDGFTSPEPNRRCRLVPGGKDVEKIPVMLNTGGLNQSPYHLIAWYQQDGVHYAQHLEGSITVVDRPVYFRWYLIAGIVFLLILSAVLLVRR